MRRWRTQARGFVAWVLAVALVTMAAGTCLAEAGMQEAQHACCIGMDHDCGPALGADCCAAGTEQSAAHVVASSPVSLPTFLAVAGAFILLPPQQPPVLGGGDAGFGRIPLKPKGPPTYLLIAALLI